LDGLSAPHLGEEYLSPDDRLLAPQNYTRDGVNKEELSEWQTEAPPMMRELYECETRMGGKLSSSSPFASKVEKPATKKSTPA